MNSALLAALLAAYAWYVRGGGQPRGAGRVGRYRRWLRRAPMAFGLTSLATLLVAGRIDTLATLPPEFAQVATLATTWAGFGGEQLKLAVLAGFGGGVVLGLLLAWWRQRRGKRPLMVGKLATVLPRTRGEIAWTAPLAISAGVLEELFFRLALPLFTALATGSAELGFALATALFAFAHRYQGWAGMAFSVLAGGLFATLYLATGSLWFAMLIHALVNLNGLALRPALLGAYHS